MIHIFLLLFLLIILLLNFVLTYIFPIAGILANSVTIILFLIFSVYDIYDTYAQDIFSLCVTFLVINFITIYLHFSDVYINSLILYLILLFIALMYCLKIFHEEKLFRLKNLRHIYIIFPIGILLAYVIYYFIGFSQYATHPLQLPQALVLISITGIAEAVFFQALIQNAVTKMTDMVIAVTFTSILYGLFHFNSSIFTTLLFILLSLIYCAIYALWKNIYISIGMNILVNVIFYILTSNLLIFAIK
ncbi:MAG TPA: CPBP family intramembrane glutamic endopeptidase [Candidatus Saccharimonadales bacterium]|nr:CPBP family intramembrane glutamic endopeptidase [Candidatus Saccharimonadales bacterium]